MQYTAQRAVDEKSYGREPKLSNALDLGTYYIPDRLQFLIFNNKPMRKREGLSSLDSLKIRK